MQQLPREEKWGYVQEDRAFVDSIVNGSKPPVTALDGLMSVEIMNAVYESVRSETSKRASRFVGVASVATPSASARGWSRRPSHKTTTLALS